MKIPKKQSDILLSTYLEYEKFISELTEEQKLDNTYIISNVVSIFYHIQNVSELPYKSVSDLYNIIENILNMKPKLVPIFNFNGTDYGINPNFNEITLAEMVDCDTTDILRQIAVLYRPIEKRSYSKYTIEKYKADISHYDRLKSNLTLDVYYGFVGFFLKIQKDLMIYTLKSLTEMDIPLEMKKTLEKNGRGLVSSMNYVMGT